MNSNYYPLIIAAAYLVIHIVSAIAKESARRKEMAKKEAERRRKTEGQLEPALTAAPSVGGPIFGPPAQRSISSTELTTTTTMRRVGKSLDDLAARRKEQLDQLRGRQGTRGVGQPAPSRSATPPTMTPGQGRDPLFRGPGSISASPDAYRANQERERRERENAKAKRERQERALRLREAEAKARQDLARQTAEKLLQSEPQQQAQAVEQQQRTAATERTGHVANLFASRLRAKGTLKELIVLKEIIDPPLAARERGF